MATRICYQDLVRENEDRDGELPPYEHLAEVWHDHASRWIPNYAGFLASVASRQAPFQSVLDLACGAGSVTEKLARVVSGVVGLDSSNAMLSQARVRCSAIPAIRFVQGDFRDFQLGEQFEAIICASDSLNYVRDVSELGEVFKCVAAHLRPGGLFVFDCLTEKGMRSLSGYYLHANVRGVRFAISFNYNRVDRKEESVVYLPTGVERHCRIPIDPSDVEAAARGNDLMVTDYFSSSCIPGRWYIGSRCFFVLTTAAHSARWPRKNQ